MPDVFYRVLNKDDDDDDDETAPAPSPLPNKSRGIWLFWKILVKFPATLPV